MARPVKVRRVCEEPKYTRFMPVGSDKYDAVVLSIEEFEVMRHVDYQKMTHEECARHMAISRTTATELRRQSDQRQSPLHRRRQLQGLRRRSRLQGAPRRGPVRREVQRQQVLKTLFVLILA